MILAAAEVTYKQNAVAYKRATGTISFVRRLGSLRNSVAHGIVVRSSDITKSLETVGFPAGPVANLYGLDPPYFITPAFYNTMKTNSYFQPRILWSSEELHSIVAEFQVLVAHLAEFTFGDQVKADAPSSVVRLTVKAEE